MAEKSPERLEWERLKAEATREARAFKRRCKRDKKPLAKCAPSTQIHYEAMIALAEVKRNRKRSEQL